jgi:hypothetical protein
MVKSKVLKQLRKKVDKVDRLENPLSLIDKEKSSLNLTWNSKEDTERNVALRKAFGHRVSSADVSDDLLRQLLELFEKNMGDFYRKSTWGPDMVKKDRGA